MTRLHQAIRQPGADYGTQMGECLHKRLSKHLQVLLMAVVALAGAGVVLVSLAMADADAGAPIHLSQGTKTLGRDLEPVIVTGVKVGAFSGLPVDELFVYSYSDGAWRQIPAQVDEVTAAGSYTTTEDGLLDANDEIVFMAKDLGDQAQDTIPMVDDWPICVKWYQIEVTDPLSPSQQGWAYLIHSSTLTPTFANNYVSFRAVPNRIDTAKYSLGFGSTHSGFESLVLGGSGVDILDRTKTRMYRGLPLPPTTEDDLGPPPDDDLIKDGPVRVIMRGGKVLAYESMVWRSVHIPKLIRPYDTALRLSTDFSQKASGSIYYNSAVTEGVTVDGITDMVPITPTSSWWQLSTDAGTLVQVSDISLVGGEPTNYYLDDWTWDPEDTGDERSYGDTAVYIADPQDPLTYTFNIYCLPGPKPNMGTTYESLYSHPLSTTVLLQELAGKILDSEHVRSYTPEEVANAAGVPSSPYGAEVYRMLYLSQAPVGTPQAVSGLIIVPTGTAPEGGFPVLSHGHGTAGMADICAPSGYYTVTLYYTATVRDLLEWVSNGYLVSATDYVGLGTPGLHPYIVGEAEAFSMLDAARAALGFHDSAQGIDEAPAANRIILEGYSQGGHAALFAHQEWPSYAPELNVLGAVAFAPASEIRFLCQQVADGWAELLAPVALGMYAYSEYYGAPDSLETWLQEEFANELPDQAASKCVLGLGILFFRADADEVFQPDLLAAVREGRWEDLQPWTVYLDANTPGNYSSDVPVLVLQGQSDDLIPPEASERLTTRLCLHGTPVKLSSYARTGHFRIPRVGRPEALQWMADRLAGVPASDSCAESLFRAFIPLVRR